VHVAGLERLVRNTIVVMTAATAGAAWLGAPGGQAGASTAHDNTSQHRPAPVPITWQRHPVNSGHPVNWHQHGDPACLLAFFGPPTGSLQKHTSAGPSGSTVTPGQAITVTLTWNPNEFAGQRPLKVDDCVLIGSHLSASLSQLQTPGPSGGTDTLHYVIPPGGTGERQICDRAVAWSNPTWFDAGHVERSAVYCYTTLAADAPEVPNVLLLPVTGLAVSGGSILLVRRRRRSRPAVPNDPAPAMGTPDL
jgi:hypothetical protein